MLFLGTWEWAVRVGGLNPLFLSAPSMVAEKLVEVFANGSIWPNIWASGQKIAEFGIELERHRVRRGDRGRIVRENLAKIVFVTHSIDEGMFLSDRIVIFGARPGRVLDVVDVVLPKRRWEDDEQIKASDPFVEYRQHIWRMLKQELQRTRPEAAVAP